MEEKLLEIENKILREMAYRYGKFLELKNSKEEESKNERSTRQEEHP